MVGKPGEIDFGPNEEADEDSFNFKGLDFLAAEELEELVDKPNLFAWPEAYPPKYGRSSWK